MRKLKDYEIAEIKEFYDGTWSSLRELAKRFGVTIARLRYLLDYKDYRRRQRGRARRWREKNPEKHREMSRKAVKRWQKRNPEKARVRQQRWYLRKVVLPRLKKKLRDKGRELNRG